MGDKVDEIGQAVRDTPELCDLEERLFPQTHHFDRQRYLDTLATFSDHATLPAEQRARLFDAIGEIIDGQFGGRVGAAFHGAAATRAATLERRSPASLQMGSRPRDRARPYSAFCQLRGPRAHRSLWTTYTLVTAQVSGTAARSSPRYQTRRPSWRKAAHKSIASPIQR
jgi:hypothetical protein